jgi:hypothetical protein
MWQTHSLMPRVGRCDPGDESQDPATPKASAYLPRCSPASASFRPERCGIKPVTVQIAELIAEGMSNREIAERLVISVRTAETHAQNILLKLGFRSRAQIATLGRGGTAQGSPHAAGRPATLT